MCKFRSRSKHIKNQQRYAMFGCIKKYMTCGSKIGRLQSQKKITMFGFLSILIEDYHSGASNFILLLSQSQFKAQRLIWIQLFHSNG